MVTLQPPYVLTTLQSNEYSFVCKTSYAQKHRKLCTVISFSHLCIDMDKKRRIIEAYVVIFLYMCGSFKTLIHISRLSTQQLYKADETNIEIIGAQKRKRSESMMVLVEIIVSVNILHDVYENINSFTMYIYLCICIYIHYILTHTDIYIYYNETASKAVCHRQV